MLYRTVGAKLNGTRVLGLDVGDRRIGAAISDPLRITAQRLTVIKRHGLDTDVEAVKKLVAQHQVSTVVVGLPLTLRGIQGPQANKVTSFTDRLRKCLDVPVELVDERLTTVQGERALRMTYTSRLRRKQLIDSVAAQLILQHYLESQRDK